METEHDRELIRAKYRADGVIMYHPVIGVEIFGKAIANLQEAAKKANYTLDDSYELIKLGE